VNNASTILGALSCLIVIPIYVFYWWGPQIRDRSKFAKSLSAEREKTGGRRISKTSNVPEHMLEEEHHQHHHQQQQA
jgi:hypothetical protein